VDRKSIDAIQESTSHCSQGLTAERVLVAPIPASTRICSTPASAMCQSPTPVTRPLSSAMTWQARRPARSRCLEDLRIGNHSSVMRRPANRDRGLTVSTTALRRGSKLHTTCAAAGTHQVGRETSANSVNKSLLAIPHFPSGASIRRKT
jgi:hypothetical protein